MSFMDSETTTHSIFIRDDFTVVNVTVVTLGADAVIVGIIVVPSMATISVSTEQSLIGTSLSKTEIGVSLSKTGGE